VGKQRTTRKKAAAPAKSGKRAARARGTKKSTHRKAARR
jgi:hypothetical protein